MRSVICILLLSVCGFSQKPTAGNSNGVGSGSVSVVGAGTLTNTACVTGGGAQTIQTPSPNCTVDSSGNVAAASIVTGGVGNGLLTLSGSTSGSWGLQALAVQGTPSSWNPPTSDPAGANYLPLFGTPSGGQIPISYVATSGTGNVLRATAVPSAQGCGTTSTCSHTAQTGAQIVYGSVPLVTGTPSTATITGIAPAYTSSSTFVCTLGAQSSATGALLSVANVSGSSFTITGPAAVTTVINYICVGT